MNNNSTSSLKLKTPFLQPSKDKILLQEKTVRDRIVGLNMQNRHISKISFKFCAQTKCAQDHDGIDMKFGGVIEVGGKGKQGEIQEQHFNTLCI